MSRENRISRGELTVRAICAAITMYIKSITILKHPMKYHFDVVIVQD
jgi:hypothetical protein